jgi:hypothetical protein
MFKSVTRILSALVLFCMPLGATNAQNPVEEALKGCSKEIEAYCSSVTPGGGRLVSCAKAHMVKDIFLGLENPVRGQIMRSSVYNWT